MMFDFTNRSADLVAEVIIDPFDCHIWDAEGLGHAVDEVENRRRRRKHKSGRTKSKLRRYRQLGASIVVALPPDREMTLDEVIEFVRRIVSVILRGLKLVVHFAIHDPWLAAITRVNNRHVHIFIPLRRVGKLGFEGNKVRDLIASPRRGNDGVFVAGGTDLQQLVRNELAHLATECGLDLVVEPVAHVSERHWSRATLNEQPEQVSKVRNRTYRANQMIMLGESQTLVDGLLRGRAIMEVKELKAHIARFFDDANERRSLLNRILSDERIVTYPTEPDRDPIFLTTTEVDRVVSCATQLVDVSTRGEIEAVSAVGHNALRAAVKGWAIENPNLMRSPVVAANDLAACDILADQPGSARTATINQLFRMLGAGTDDISLVVVAHCECIDDESLARLLNILREKKSPVLLAHDRSRRSGIVTSRLAAYAVDVLAKVNIASAGVGELLQSGLIRNAVRAMDKKGALQFVKEQISNASGDSGFAVFDEDVAKINARFRPDQTAANASSGAAILRGSHLNFAVGEWISFSRTDYSTCPPVVRAGRLAKIAHIMGSNLVLECDGGGSAILDLAKFPHVVPTHALNIRQARQIMDPQATLRVHITNPRHAWAALVLASRGPGHSVDIATSVARDVEDLMKVIERSVPGPLPSHLRERGQVHVKPDESLKLEVEFLEKMPVPRTVSAQPPNFGLDRLLSDQFIMLRNVEDGFERMVQAIVRLPDSERVVDSVYKCAFHKPTVKLIQTLEKARMEGRLTQGCSQEQALEALASIRITLVEFGFLCDDLRAMSWQLRPMPSALISDGKLREQPLSLSRLPRQDSSR